MLLLATVYGSPNNLVIIHNLWPLFPKHTTSTSTKSHGSKVRVSAKASATRSAIRCGPPFRSPAQRPRRSPTQRADSAPMTSEEDVAGCVNCWDPSWNPSKRFIMVHSFPTDNGFWCRQVSINVIKSIYVFEGTLDETAPPRNLTQKVLGAANCSRGTVPLSLCDPFFDF